MKFGFILPNFGGRIGAPDLVKIAKVCEEEEFDSAWAVDHIIVPKEWREPYGQLLEPIVTLAFVAAATKKLRLGTSIVVLPQRNPILVAKQAATLDVFSGGRVILGFGIGWAEKEFGYLGADFRRRGSVTEEGIKLMKSLWSDDIVNFEGRYFKVEDAVFFPKPAQGVIPIWVGGNSDAAIRRAIRVGDGWHPTGIPLEQFRHGAEIMMDSGRKLTLSLRMTVDLEKKRADTVGTHETRTLFSGGPTEVRRSIDAYASAGMEYFCAGILYPSAGEIIDGIRKFSSDVMKSYT